MPYLPPTAGPIAYITAIDTTGSPDAVVALTQHVIDMAVQLKLTVNLSVYLPGELYPRLQIMGSNSPVVIEQPPPAPKKQVRVKPGTKLNIRISPVNGAIIGSVSSVDGWFGVIGEQAGWYKIYWQNKNGWVSGNYVETQIL